MTRRMDKCSAIIMITVEPDHHVAYRVEEKIPACDCIGLIECLIGLQSMLWKREEMVL